MFFVFVVVFWFCAVFCSRYPAVGSLGSVARVLSGARVVGFSGSRSVVPAMPLCSVLPLVPFRVPVVVGCARGVDQAVRGSCARARVFCASSFGFGARSFALRSAALVAALGGAGGVLVSFPGRSCPVGLVPVSSWPWGVGSGSWGSLALAVGSGCSVVVWLPVGVVPPAWCSVALGGGWFSG